MIKQKISTGSIVTWNGYWDYKGSGLPSRIKGTVKYVSVHKGRSVAKVFFKDQPGIPFWVPTAELILALN